MASYANGNSGAYPNSGNYPNMGNQYGGNWQQQYGNGYEDQGRNGGYQGNNQSTGYQGNNQGGGNPYGFSNWGGNNGGSGGRGNSGYNRGGGMGKGVKRTYNGGWRSGGSGGDYDYSEDYSGGNSRNDGGKWGRQSERGGFDYNSNPEWYDDGNDYGYDNNSGGQGGYQGRRPWWGPQAPFRPTGSYNRVWQRGMPRLEDKQKAVAIAKAAEKKPRSKKKMAISKKRVESFKELMAQKNKYRSVRQNKFISIDEQIVLVYLKRIAYEMCEPDLMVHCINFSKLASRHPNALKIFTYEAKIQLDRKYDLAEDGNMEKRKQYLKDVKEDIINGFKRCYKNRAAKEDMSLKEALIDERIDILSGEKFTSADVPTDEDYLFDKNHSRREEDFINDFKSDFVFNCYEVFKFKPDEHKTPTKDIGKRMKFHLENPILPFLLVESVRGKKLVTSVPEPVSTYLFLQSEVHQKKNQVCLDDVLGLCKETGETVVTPITKYIAPGSDYSTEVYRDFADCILMFDKFATYIKYRLLKFTPHIILPDTAKEKLYDQLVDDVYRGALNILVKNEKMDEYKFVDMEGDEVKEEEKADIKNEDAETKAK